MVCRSADSVSNRNCLSSMDSDFVKAFNAELSSIYDSRPPLGKKKIQDISKAALKAKLFYKHVVFSVEKFLGKCKVEYKIPCLYVIDSIIRASRHQFKEKDVYAARFLKCFSKTLTDLLQCPVNEQCRVVRTLNLWVANGVYTEDQIAPFKSQCRDMGIETDIAAVERAVKGSKADLSIYGIVAEKTQTPQFEARTPPMPPPNSNTKVGTPAPAALPTSQEEPSDVIPEGCISERQLLHLLRQAGCDFNGAFSSDTSLLRKAHSVICQTLRSRQQSEIERQKGGNIKNLLSSNFDYSDEEDSGDEGGARKQAEIEPKPMSLEQVLELADTLIRDPQVIDALKTMQQERVSRLNQVAVLAQQQQRAALSHQMQSLPPHSVSGMNVCVPPPGMNNLPPGTVPSSLAGHLLPGGVPVSLPGLPPGFQLPAGLQGLAGLPGLAGIQLPGMPGLPPMVSAANNAAGQQQAAQNAQAQALLGLLSNPMNMLGQPPPNLPFSPNRPMPSGVPPSANMELIKQQQELLKQLQSGNLQQMQQPPPMGVPPPGMGLMGSAPPGMAGMPPNSTAAAAQQQMQMLADGHGAGDMGNGDENDGSRRRDGKRSRSRDRSDQRQKKSRDRKDKDKEKERKKLGLAPVVPGFTQVASKTLWFGRLPPNCSEHDIRSAVSSAGDVRRVNIIASKACGYVTMDSRKSAFDVINRLARDMQMRGKPVKVNFAMGNGCKSDQYKAWWDAEKGITSVPWGHLPSEMEAMCDGAYLDVDSLPANKQMLYTDSGSVAVEVPPAAADEDEGTGMDLSSPQCSPPSINSIGVATHHSSGGGPSTPVKPPGPFPFMMSGVPPPGMPPPGGMPGMPPGMPPPHMQFMRMPPGMGRPPIPGQMMMPPPGMSMPPPGTPGGIPPSPAGSVNSPMQQSPFPGGPPGRGGFNRGGFRGGRGGPGFGGGRGGGFQAVPANSGGNQQELDGGGRPPWLRQQSAEGSSASFDDESQHMGRRDAPQHHLEVPQRRRDVDEGRPRDDSGRFGGDRDRDRERPSRWENKDRDGGRDRSELRTGGGERGERRRTRWGDREEEPTRPAADERRIERRDERDDRRRDDVSGDRDRERERDRDRDRRDERRDRSRERRRNRSRSRERRSRRERESPRYDDVPSSDATAAPIAASSDDAIASSEAGAGDSVHAHGDTPSCDDAMVTSTTDVEAATAAAVESEAGAADDQKQFSAAVTCNDRVTMDTEDNTRARMMEDDLLENALNSPAVE